MQLINDLIVKYSADDNSYSVNCELPDTDYNDVFFKFDTGAAHTIITLPAFIEVDSASYKQRFLIAEQLRNSKYEKMRFNATFGDTRQGILCQASNVILNGCMFEDFYFYLIIPNKEEEVILRRSENNIIEPPKALLGMDFISCCDFEGKTQNDIVVTEFHNSRYISNKLWLHKDDVLNINSLDESGLLTAGVSRQNIRS